MADKPRRARFVYPGGVQFFDPAGSQRTRILPGCLNPGLATGRRAAPIVFFFKEHHHGRD
jgi:hypothetical protein